MIGIDKNIQQPKYREPRHTVCDWKTGDTRQRTVWIIDEGHQLYIEIPHQQYIEIRHQLHIEIRPKLQQIWSLHCITVDIDIF